SYDYTLASLCDKAGIDVLLVGDSAGMVMLGYENTVTVTMDQMCMFTEAVSRARKNALLVSDLPFMSYQASIEDAISNSGKLIKAGADAVNAANAAANRAANAVTAAPIDMSTVTSDKITGLTSQLRNAFPSDTPPRADQLLNFFTKKGLSAEDARQLAKTITGGDSASGAERFRDLWRMGRGDTSVLNAVKGLNDLPRAQYDALMGQSGVTTNIGSTVKESSYKKMMKNIYL
ncbi:MAG: 3-methyl-2-oxobutanoate hydroxymethyltransferase, partial [Minisyncoccia bacterium]